MIKKNNIPIIKVLVNYWKLVLLYLWGYFSCTISDDKRI